MHMKTKYTLFRRGEVFYAQDSTTGKQTSLRTKDETEARSLLNLRSTSFFQFFSAAFSVTVSLVFSLLFPMFV